MNSIFRLLLLSIFGLALIGIRPALAIKPVPTMGTNGEPVAVRVENLTLPPGHLPMLVVDVKNISSAPYSGIVSVDVPEDWTLAARSKPVEIEPWAMERVFFALEKGLNLEANEYRITARAVGAGRNVSRTQTITACSAPYFKPTIDGRHDDWKDAIPACFPRGETGNAKKTTISTYWNRRQFSMLIAVEEDKLVTSADSKTPDAIQLAIAPGDVHFTPRTAGDPCGRFEYLIIPDGEGSAKCYALATPELPLGKTQEDRPLEDLLNDSAEIVVTRQDGTTYYELNLSLTPMRDAIQPSEGRELCMSLLVHDQDGTGTRDWGEAAGLWPCMVNRFAWSQWPGKMTPGQTYYDNKTRWGMCSSKY